MPSCLGIGGHPRWVPTKTPIVHWGLNSRKAVGGPFGSDSRHTGNMVAEQVVKTGRLVAGVERGTTGDVQRKVTQSGLGRRTD